MAVTNTFDGQLTDYVAQEVIPHLGVALAPFNQILTDFSAEAGRGQPAIITTEIEAPQGRRAQTLDREKRTYGEFNADAKVVEQKEVAVYPDAVSNAEVDIPLEEFSFLKNPAYVRMKILPAVKEALLRQVAKDFFTYMSPFQFIDVAASTATGDATDAGISAKFPATVVDFNELSINLLNTLETNLFDMLIPVDEGLTLIHVGQLDLSSSTGGGNLNWINYMGGSGPGTESLRNKKYPMVKNTNLFRSQFIKESITNLGQANETSTISIEKDGLALDDIAPGNDAGNRNSRKPFTPNVYPGQANSLELKGTGSWTFKNVVDKDGSDATLMGTDTVVGAIFHKRALACAAWPNWSSDELTGQPFPNVQMSTFVDPLTSFPMRLMAYFVPEKKKYVFDVSAKYGFTVADPRAAHFLIKTAA